MHLEGRREAGLTVLASMIQGAIWSAEANVSIAKVAWLHMLKVQSRSSQRARTIFTFCNQVHPRVHRPGANPIPRGECGGSPRTVRVVIPLSTILAAHENLRPCVRGRAAPVDETASQRHFCRRAPSDVAGFNGADYVLEATSEVVYVHHLGSA